MEKLATILFFCLLQFFQLDGQNKSIAKSETRFLVLSKDTFINLPIQTSGIKETVLGESLVNFVALRIRMKGEGKLGFDIIPESNKCDCDFVMYNITGKQNETTENLIKNLEPIRSNFANCKTSGTPSTGLSSKSVEAYVKRGNENPYSSVLTFSNDDVFLLLINKREHCSGVAAAQFKLTKNFSKSPATGKKVNKQAVVKLYGRAVASDGHLQQTVLGINYFTYFLEMPINITFNKLNGKFAFDYIELDPKEPNVIVVSQPGYFFIDRAFKLHDLSKIKGRDFIMKKLELDSSILVTSLFLNPMNVLSEYSIFALGAISTLLTENKNVQFVMKVANHKGNKLTLPELDKITVALIKYFSTHGNETGRLKIVTEATIKYEIPSDVLDYSKVFLEITVVK